MPRTFDIRFARATGLAALFEAPANTFRWRGTASLTIDDTGVEIEPGRSLHTLLTRPGRFRINTADLREVSRAADALRIEFGTPGARRAVVPFWAKDPDTAAEIMRLVPTRRTIETDEPGARNSGRPRRGWKVAAALVFAAIGFAAWRVMQTDAPPAPDTVSAAESSAPAATPAPIPADLPPPGDPLSLETPSAAARPASFTRTSAPADRVAEPVEPPADALAAVAAPAAAEVSGPALPADPAAARMVVFAPGNPLYERASRQFEVFQEHAARFYVRYLDSAPPAELATSWEQFSQAVTGSPEFLEPALRPMIDDELVAAASWSRALTAYSEALQSREPAKLAAARADLERASEQTTHVALHIERR